MDRYLENIGLDDSGITLPTQRVLRTTRASGIIEINNEITFKIIEDLKEVSFNSLYAHLLIKFYDAGIFERNGINIDSGIIESVNRYFFIRKNMNSFTKDEYTDIKIWVNSIYNSELREYTPMIFELYRQYMRQFWDDFIEDNQFVWLYVDTDCAFVSGGLKSLDLVSSIGIHLI
jgi:hypothetical protein